MRSIASARGFRSFAGSSTRPPRPQSERDRQVRGADVEAVEARRGRDLVEVVEPVVRLDHRETQRVPAEDLGIGRPGGHLGADRPVRAPAVRRVAARLHRAGCLGRVVDQRQDHAGGADVERAHDQPRLVPRQPRHRHRAGAPSRLEHRQERRLGRQSMLQVGAHEVVAGEPPELRRERAWDPRPQPEHGLSRLPLCTQPLARRYYRALH